MDKYVRVVKSAREKDLEDKINNVLEENSDSELIDIKLTGSYNGNTGYYLAVIIFRNN
ncbi:sporulation protein Cse60 [Priestia sp. J2]|uniref:sporulation protein Cse60 n=1 Tax=Priestia sp. J2 TaxID=2886505 RepID=UPI001E29F2C0|nr:sporulation protein Cse60 [Priestia sp. J2]